MKTTNWNEHASAAAGVVILAAVLWMWMVLP